MQNDVLGGGRSSGFSPTVTIVSSDGRYALTAAEMASIEALKTREKLKTKADHVARFHRKVVRRLAIEKRAADACVLGGKTINAHIQSVDSFDDFGDVLESSGLTRGEEQGALWDHASSSLEAPRFQAVKVIGVRGDRNSLSDADMGARMALAAYRR